MDSEWIRIDSLVDGEQQQLCRCVVVISQRDALVFVNRQQQQDWEQKLDLAPAHLTFIINAK